MNSGDGFGGSSVFLSRTPASNRLSAWRTDQREKSFVNGYPNYGSDVDRLTAAVRPGESLALVGRNVGWVNHRFEHGQIVLQTGGREEADGAHGNPCKVCECVGKGFCHQLNSVHQAFV